MINTKNNPSRCDISWKNNTTPFSNKYGDVYFSADNGLDESQYIFINSNNLYERFVTQNDFYICETGFGTGLNFAVACKLWQKLSSPDSILFFTTFEKHPLNQKNFAQAANSWPELTDIYSEIIPSYKGLRPGNNIITLDNLRVSLNIIIGDINDTISSLPSSSIECWFLDGFAPSLNPEMWTDTVISNIARASTKEATFSTFTAAGNVRRSMLKHGFEVVKKPGFGKKREMIYGKFTGS